MPFQTGWARDREDFDYLATPTVRQFGAPDGFIPPPSMSFRGILKSENQGNMSSCVGHGGSTGMECLQYLANRGTVQLSRMFCYLESQKQSGIRGDNGATIAGCAKALATVGICEEAAFPYPNRYASKVPESAVTAAAVHKIRGHQELKSYREVFDWISQAKGPVVFGMSWFDRVSGGNGLVSENDLRGPSAGGHCLAFVGYPGERDDNGDYLIDCYNSHGTQSGQGGVFKWTPKAVDVLCQQERGQASVIGITDITGFDAERLIDFSRII